MNKPELLAKIFESRSRLGTALGKLQDSQMELRILYGNWSVKDLLGHLAFWEDVTLKSYQKLSAGVLPELFKDLDEINHKKISEFTSLSLEQVREMERLAYHDLIKFVEQMPDEDLFDGNRFPWTDGRPFSQIIADNTYEHYDEHLVALEAWIKRVA